jgi:hypothetical protein
MNDSYIVTVFVLIDDLLQVMDYQDDSRATMSGAEIMTVAVLAAKYFQNHHERALYVLAQLGYVTALSVSRFNRRLHALGDCFESVLGVLGQLGNQQQVFIIDSSPLPVCHTQRAERCTKVTGDQYWGYCATKQVYFFGWKLHLVCTVDGIPVSFDVLPASHHDLCPVQHLLADLPAGAWVLADKAYNSAHDEQLAWVHSRVRLIPKRRRNMSPNDQPDARLLKAHRSMIETVYSQLEKMGIQRLHARTTRGFAVKVLASLLALAFTNAF